jgi:peptide/nickel transport system ATP-binding protein
MMNDRLLDIQNLSIEYRTRKGTIAAVNNVNLELNAGETLGLVGETGAGKTTTALGILNLVPDPPGKIVAGSIVFNGRNLLELTPSDMRQVRGKDISMIFQDPMTALNPIMTIGAQVMEVVKLHNPGSHAEVEGKALKILELVGIARDRFTEYPHQFSGGMKQRVIIAIALACNPQLLIADEPTTALDVTIQAQVLDLMKNLKAQLGTAMLLISHDLGVVAENCDRVAIMYAGEIIEIGALEDIFDRGGHPYTLGLFGAIPDIKDHKLRLNPIHGLMPDPTCLPRGCKFAPRCPRRFTLCDDTDVNLIKVSEFHQIRCLLFRPDSQNDAL